MIAAMNERGVAPLDIKPGNLCEATHKRFYWLDFERARLRSQPGGKPSCRRSTTCSASCSATWRS